jgi:hypothetical protein
MGIIPGILSGLKSWFTAILLLCFAIGYAGGLGRETVSRPSRGCACRHDSSRKAPCENRQAPGDPCATCCAFCSNCLVTGLSAPDEFWIRFTIARRPADPDWRASGRNYPPPLPPPRLLA